MGESGGRAIPRSDTWCHLALGMHGTRHGDGLNRIFVPNQRVSTVRVEREKEREWVVDGQHGDGTIAAKVGR